MNNRTLSGVIHTSVDAAEAGAVDETVNNSVEAGTSQTVRVRVRVRIRIRVRIRVGFRVRVRVRGYRDGTGIGWWSG